MIDYPKGLDMKKMNQLDRWLKLKAEQGVTGLDTIVDEIHLLLDAKIEEVDGLADAPELARQEPNDLASIRRLRPAGARRIWDTLPEGEFEQRLRGALLGRFAGCLLGAPLELYSVEAMESWAAYIGDPFPPTDYWSRVPRPTDVRYAVSRRDDFSREKMDHVPADDDIGYTILGLLILEECGLDFTRADVALMWQKYLIRECSYTAERITYDNLARGLDAATAGEVGNYDRQLIGADIRSDPWGYAAPGWPERAAELAHRDASLSHRRNGIYGEMYFAAAISAAFTVDDPVEALRLGLAEIPAECLLAEAVRWALAEAPNIHDYRDAHRAVTERYGGMDRVHTINNACLTVWGITLGGRDLTEVISQTVAMGFDNDCTAATAGSIVGAVIGIDNISEHWYRPFNNRGRTYLRGRNDYQIDDLLARFAHQARRVFAAG